MANETSILVRLSLLDKAALRELAMRLQRNQNETIRALIRETLVVLKEQDLKTDGKETERKEKTPAAI